MKRYLILFILSIWFSSGPAFSQATASGNITAASTDCSIGAACLSIHPTASNGLSPESASVVITGTWTGTLQFESSTDGITYVSETGYPKPSGTGVTSTTGNGTWVFNIAAMNNFRVRASTISGTASVAVKTSTALARQNGATGVGGSGTANTLSKFTDPSTMGDSQITDTGSLITIPGNIDLSFATAGSVPFFGASGLLSQDNANFSYNSTLHSLTATTFVGALTGNVTGNVSGTSGSATGNAANITGQLPIGQVGSAGMSGTGCIAVASTGVISCATGVTSAAALTSNAVVIGGGLQASSTISADTTTTHALMATAGAPAFRALVAADIPTLIPIANVGSSGLSGTGCIAVASTGVISCATGVTSAAALTSNAVVIGGGLQASSTISADTTTTHALMATAGAPAFRALVAADIPTLIPIANVGSSGLSGTSPITISAAGAIGCATCITTASGQVLNQPTIGISGTSDSTHINNVGTAPTCTGTGGGTGPAACTIDTGSTDRVGIATISTGTLGPSSSSTITINLNSSMGTNMAVCQAILVSGSAAWPANSTVQQTTQSKTAPVFTWTGASATAAVALTASKTYKMAYFCEGI